MKSLEKKNWIPNVNQSLFGFWLKSDSTAFCFLNDQKLGQHLSYSSFLKTEVKPWLQVGFVAGLLCYVALAWCKLSVSVGSERWSEVVIQCRCPLSGVGLVRHQPAGSLWGLWQLSVAIWHTSKAITHPSFMKTSCHNSFRVRLFTPVPHTSTVSRRRKASHVWAADAVCCHDSGIVFHPHCAEWDISSKCLRLSLAALSSVASVVQLQVALGTNQPNVVPH